MWRSFTVGPLWSILCPLLCGAECFLEELDDEPGELEDELEEGPEDELGDAEDPEDDYGGAFLCPLLPLECGEDPLSAGGPWPDLSS